MCPCLPSKRGGFDSHTPLHIFILKMNRAKPKSYRTPRIHELSSTSTIPRGNRRSIEDWSMRSAPHRQILRTQAIYVLHACGTPFYKIGTAANIEARRRELQCGNPFVLELVYSFVPNGNARRLEAVIHQRARDQKRGSPADNEYFKFENRQEVIDFVKTFGM